MKTARPPSWQILLAFAIIYFVWGSTFLAIRVGVREVPPFLLAAMRFFAAGLILYVWIKPAAKNRIAASRNGGTSRTPDRKSTRLNSSHTVISYAVFCLKKKKTQQD